jgi:hypothetical protein
VKAIPKLLPLVVSGPFRVLLGWLHANISRLRLAFWRKEPVLLSSALYRYEQVSKMHSNEIDRDIDPCDAALGNDIRETETVWNQRFQLGF